MQSIITQHIKRFLGILLTVTILLSDIPMITQASSEELTNNATVASENAAVATEANGSSEEPHILYELTEKRDEITKHFAMSDGSIKAYVYPQHVHYLEDEKYEEIDNTLLEHAENGKNYYKNKKNDFSVKIPESFTDDYIEFSDDNGYVKFKLLGSNNKKIEKITKTKSTKDKDITVVQNVNDKAIFKSVKGNVDIEYDIAGNKLKEFA